MTANSARIEQWNYVIAEFKLKLAEQKEILLKHSSSFSRGWSAGLSVGLQKASMFSYSVRHNDTFPLPPELSNTATKEELLRLFLEWLIALITSKNLFQDEDGLSDISDMDEFHSGKLFGLQDWKRNL